MKSEIITLLNLYFLHLTEAREKILKRGCHSTDTQQIGDRLTLTGSLTIHGDDRSLTRQATGTEDIDCSSYGDPSSNAEAMALRRCCAKFGLGRDLWRKNKPQPLKIGQRQEPEKQTVLAPGTISREEWLKRKAGKT